MRGTAMTGEKFTLMQYSVHAILGLIDAEDFVIPEIQRPFVWKRSQVRDLIDSLYNGYPTGYIITWKNPDVKTKARCHDTGSACFFWGVACKAGYAKAIRHKWNCEKWLRI